MTEEQQLAHVQAVADQAWKNLEALLPDIERIAEHGPNDSPVDRQIVRMVCYGMAGDIHMRKDAANKIGI